MKTIFLGDSLTQGMPGVSYCRFFANKRDLINKGLGGDTLIGAKRRLGKMLKKARYANVDRYVIEIGTNDILLPFLKTRFPLWRFTVWLKEKLLGCIPAADLGEFHRQYEEMLKMLRSANKKVAVIGLPFIENDTLPLNDSMAAYNSAIVALCKKYKIPYFDLKALELEIKGDHCGSYFFGRTNFGNVIDTILTSFLPFSMAVSKARNLSVTVDGVHPNKETAKKLAIAVEKHL